MISAEPVITVGIIQHAKAIEGIFHGFFELPNSVRLQGPFTVSCLNGSLVFKDNEDVEVIRSRQITCLALNKATFTLRDVSIGINFHWERKENQSFEGNLFFFPDSDETICAVNKIGVEKYLESVISSEMSAEAPVELLKAHAVASRSWLAAALERKVKKKDVGQPPGQFAAAEDEVIKWYDREDHASFDVCADDHCQRYQGITKVISGSVEEAVAATRGQFILFNNEICDARFSKVCGGRTEVFENTWEPASVPYLQSVSDSKQNHPRISNESDAECWFMSSPDVFCNTTDGKIIKSVLPSFDRETADFFRWRVEYTQEQLAEIIQSKSGIDFGIITDLEPLLRGPSGRICRLKIIGTKRTVTVGKELEIRRWLSSSHLYSSAFIIKIERDKNDVPVKFIFNGAGWGHGVGMCQVGAAVMAIKGFKAEEILKHYFCGVELKKLY
ncbi:MAG: SpoIID/LytB domain-containing protein [Bacteroidetes bacterium]|nr:SpoIID/LytB domain-containing protein [Bacteroidota bacterium]